MPDLDAVRERESGEHQGQRQRELTDPRVQQNIRETLLNRKDQLLRAAYYEVARDEAKVVNYLASKVSSQQTGEKK